MRQSKLAWVSWFAGILAMVIGLMSLDLHPGSFSAASSADLTKKAGIMSGGNTIQQYVSGAICSQYTCVNTGPNMSEACQGAGYARRTGSGYFYNYYQNNIACTPLYVWQASPNCGTAGWVQAGSCSGLYSQYYDP
jgi:hypothetical protein